MQKSTFVKRAFVLLLAVALLAVGGCARAAVDTEVVIFKIGQADAILITSGGHAVLLDAGEDEDAAEILSHLKQRNIPALDAMIITHFDKDHVGGADGVLLGIPVKALYDADYEGKGKQYEPYLRAIEAAGVPRTRVSEETALSFGPLSFTLLPSELSTESDNDLSLAVLMTDGYHRFFFAGDAEEARIDELLEGELSPCDVLKMPHHGRYKQNLPALLDALSPRHAVVTDSDKNPAEAKTLSLLEGRGIQTRATRDGDVLIVSNEKGITVSQ